LGGYGWMNKQEEEELWHIADKLEDIRYQYPPAQKLLDELIEFILENKEK
jgi:hypothetical protein